MVILTLPKDDGLQFPLLQYFLSLRLSSAAQPDKGKAFAKKKQNEETAIMTTSTISLLFSAISLLLMVIILLSIVKNRKSGRSAAADQELLSRIKEAATQEGGNTREAVLGNLSLQNQNLQTTLKNYSEAVNGLIQAETDMAERLQQKVNDGLKEITNQLKLSADEMRTSNEKELDKMRQTVDEKLQTTLNERFKASFNMVNETLENITKNVGEMTSLTNDVVDLKKVLTNVKTRGTWGEVSLDNLLSQLLTSDQYERSFNLDKTTGSTMVDFAIKMPGKNNEKVYLPLDAKFPMEDYLHIINAKDMTEQEVARKNFAKAIKTQAESISKKYIKPPFTTDFAVMYLPTEGLFAEVMQCAGLQEELQQKYHVTICSPTTLGVFLNCLQMGFKTVAIEERSAEIWKLMGTFKKDFENFSNTLISAQKQLNTVSNTIIQASKRTRIIQKHLKDVENCDTTTETEAANANEDIDNEMPDRNKQE